MAILKLYNQKHEFLGHITTYRDLKIESEASNGNKTLYFTYLRDDGLIKNEFYLRTETDEYVVKEIDQNNSPYPDIVAVLNLEGLQGHSFQQFQFEEKRLVEAAELAVENTDWTIGSCDIFKLRNASMPKCTALTVIENLCTVFMAEPIYDTLRKEISFAAKRGTDKGAYFISGLNLKKLSKKSDSNGFFTRIIPIGKDGLTINEVNEGKNYLDNHQYSDKVIQFIWEDDNYTKPGDLMDDAMAYLKDKSKPYLSYSADIVDLAAQKPEYSILSYELGDTVRLIDSTTGTMEEQRIVKMTEYPDEPEKNTCEMANAYLTFEEWQERLNAAASLVENSLTSDGKIYVSDILEWEKGVAESQAVQDLWDGQEQIQENVDGFISGVYEPAIAEMQRQLDGQIETWYYDYAPTDTNEPASLWKTPDDKAKHVGDMFFDKAAGTTYRYTLDGDVYKWEQVKDEDIGNALKAASDAQDTADSKRRVFVKEPVPPYDVGDLWAEGKTGDLWRCHTGKPAGGVYDIADWEYATKYTDDKALHEFIENSFNTTVNELTQQADKKAETWYQATDPSKGEAWGSNDHTGDLWYDTANQKTYIYDGETWQETKTNPPDAVFDEIDGKAQIFTAQPTHPYYVGDLWFKDENSDIKTCIKDSAGKFQDSDWQKRNKYTDDTKLNNFIANEFKTLTAQADKKAETWYQPNDPSKTDAWGTNDHTGDIWYNTTEGVKKFYRWDGSAWVLMDSTPPDDVMDTLDGKAQIYVDTPTPPYHVGDLWFQSETSDIKTCIKDSAGKFQESDWQKRNKYTDDSELKSFITDTYTKQYNALKAQADKKAETWYQATDPSTAWTTPDLKTEHTGDIWYDTTNQTTKQWSGTGWQEMKTTPPANVFDRIDGKAQIFIEQPKPPYFVGDLWLESTEKPIRVCYQGRESGSFVDADWRKQDSYVGKDVTDPIEDKADSANDTLDSWGYGDGRDTIDGANIQAGTIKASKIDVTDLFAQDITATGTITGANFVGATGAFSGTVTATAGTIGGCAIVNGVLQVGSANIGNIDASKITSGTLSADRIGAKSITASKIDVDNLFAQDITATGTISGVTLEGCSIYIGGDTIGTGIEFNNSGLDFYETSSGYDFETGYSTEVYTDLSLNANGLTFYYTEDVQGISIGAELNNTGLHLQNHDSDWCTFNSVNKTATISGSLNVNSLSEGGTSLSNKYAIMENGYHSSSANINDIAPGIYAINGYNSSTGRVPWNNCHYLLIVQGSNGVGLNQIAIITYKGTSDATALIKTRHRDNASAGWENWHYQDATGSTIKTY